MWYEPVFQVAPVTVREHITTKLHDHKTALDEQKRMEMQIRALHRCPRDQNRRCFRGVRGTNLNAHTVTPTHQHTREERTTLFKKGTLWASGLGIFSQAPAHM